MILQYEKSYKKFKINFQNLRYLKVLFSLDNTYTDHLKLFTDEYIESNIGSSLCNKIMTMLKNDNIYEYQDTFGYTLPIIVVEEYQTMIDQGIIGDSLYPMSSQSSSFLIEFGSFVNATRRILINPGLKRSENPIE